MYMIVGYVVEVIGGKKFEELIKEKIWDLLGMNVFIFLDDMLLRDDYFVYLYFKVNEIFSFNEDDFFLYRYMYIKYWYVCLINEILFFKWNINLLFLLFFLY